MPNTPPPGSPSLLLASASRYRAELLSRLQLTFESKPSQIDETPLPHESAAALVQRLSVDKARALQAEHPQHWIIGSDQAAVIDGRIVGKPGTRERAVAQLSAASGRSVQFMTGVALLTPQGMRTDMDITTVHFRSLEHREIERYLDTEAVLDCAGSFKCEGYGISLFEAIDSRDPTALVGLPLISLCRLLRTAGYRLP